MRLKGKNAIVTGAGQGFGLAIARTFAAEGARVACLDRNEATARAAAAKIGAGAIALVCDVARRAEVEAASAAAIHAFGRIDILVNNAGTSHRNRPMLDV
jgi:3-oxoacyl-[acyl-carrier protein] reductase